MVNYKNSIIYKLCCRDPDIKDIYIGSTTNFRTRKHDHKKICENKTGTYKNAHFYVYQFIREHGGWNNWDMVEVEKYECNDRKELHCRERYHIEQLGAGLNKNIPTRTHKEYMEENKERLNKQRKEYREANKEKIRERDRARYPARSASVLTKAKEKVTCECGSIIARGNLSDHRRTAKHIKLMEEKEEQKDDE